MIRSVRLKSRLEAHKLNVKTNRRWPIKAFTSQILLIAGQGKYFTRQLVFVKLLWTINNII